ncbi:MAG: alpha/beta hydrolase, partial [Oscillospiraceae bacterium]|nr:alpha/beta hydrolase [Oscillospiraceae bacterium]
MVTALPFTLLSEENYNAEMEQVMLRLEQLRQATGICARIENLGIYWEYYAPDAGCDKVIFLSHGFTESTLEYSELIAYFLKWGYGVFICDHMGHGKSYRLVRETWLTHITSFSDYIKDLH